MRHPFAAAAVGLLLGVWTFTSVGAREALLQNRSTLGSEGAFASTIANFVPGAADWTLATPATSPPGRCAYAMAFDSGRQRTVLFGGEGNSRDLADTWEWDGSNWIDVTPPSGPSSRRYPAMAYDSTRQRMVLFGGYTPFGGTPVHADTWEWDGNDWIQLSPATSPSPRWGHRMAYDDARQRMILFGGYDGLNRFNDTWEWDGTTWLERSPTTKPPARDNHGMAYDSARQLIVLFGGYFGFSDTWEWDGNDWVQRVPASSPPPRGGTAMAFDTARNSVVLFGGEGPILGLLLADTWEWNGNDWVQEAPAASPPARYLHSAAYDSANGLVLLFGGLSNGIRLADTWQYRPIEDCNGVDDDGDGIVPANEVDHDGDGYVVCGPWDGPDPNVLGGGDCNDADIAINPVASELCNSTDDNCDGNVDEGFDRDGDGFTSCSGDCDDGDVSVYPGASQLCDGENTDCLDQTWPTAPPSEIDHDIDHYVTCAPWVGDDPTMLGGADCNDSNASVYPQAPETCDGVDNQCPSDTGYGQVDEDAVGVDSDGDTVHNACDNCRFAFNPDQFESDGDGVGNACDNCITAANPDQSDRDSDQRGDLCDNCPLSYNPFQDDFDLDRRGDACDNCIWDYNPSQSDVDHDDEGDSCDINDGVIYVFAGEREYREWQPETGYGTWNSYRGSLAVLRATGQYTQAPGSDPLAARDCGLTNPWVLDELLPSLGDLAFFLTTGVAGGAESSLGANSAGVSRPNANPCP